MGTYDAWDITPVANPDLPDGRRYQLIRKAAPPPGHRTPMRQVLHRDDVVAPLALDLPCRQLLHRAQHAIGSVFASEVYTADLRTTVPTSVLKQHEWEIAVALRNITELRAEYASNSSTAGSGPMTAAVLASQQRALTLAQDATASRVSALERFAAQVHAVDAAQRDWQVAMRVAGLNDKYLDLVARTAADQHAIAEITNLTRQAAEAARVFQDSLQQATLAAEALTLPPEG